MTLDIKDYILVFPADSGIKPLYVVFKKTERDEPGVVTGHGEEIMGIWLEKASKGLGAPIPKEIADKLRGKEFANWDKFREAFWKEVSNDQKLLKQFIQALEDFNSLDINWTEEDFFVERFNQIVKHPKKSDLMFDTNLPYGKTVESIVNEIKRWYKEQGLPCFKDD